MIYILSIYNELECLQSGSYKTINSDFIKDTYAKFYINMFCLQVVVNYFQACCPVENFNVNSVLGIVLKNHNYSIVTVTNMNINKSVKTLITYK